MLAERDGLDRRRFGRAFLERLLERYNCVFIAGVCNNQVAVRIECEQDIAGNNGSN